MPLLLYSEKVPRFLLLSKVKKAGTKEKRGKSPSLASKI
jgi:hypothetical protein